MAWNKSNLTAQQKGKRRETKNIRERAVLQVWRPAKIKKMKYSHNSTKINCENITSRVSYRKPITSLPFCLLSPPFFGVNRRACQVEELWVLTLLFLSRLPKLDSCNVSIARNSNSNLLEVRQLNATIARPRVLIRKYLTGINEFFVAGSVPDAFTACGSKNNIFCLPFTLKGNVPWKLFEDPTARKTSFSHPRVL